LNFYSKKSGFHYAGRPGVQVGTETRGQNFLCRAEVVRFLRKFLPAHVPDFAVIDTAGVPSLYYGLSLMFQDGIGPAGCRL
jgi:hypothetical protein